MNTAGLHYKTRNSSETWSGIVLPGARRHLRVDHGWYPPDIDAIELSKQAEEERASKPKNPEHAIRKLTRPYHWLRREAISNLRIMQALSRPRMPRRVLTPGQGDEAAPGGFGCKRIGPTGRLARYYAACYVEIPWDERQRALGMLEMVRRTNDGMDMHSRRVRPSGPDYDGPRGRGGRHGGPGNTP